MNHKHITRFSSHKSYIVESLGDEEEEKDSDDHDSTRSSDDGGDGRYVTKSLDIKNLLSPFTFESNYTYATHDKEYTCRDTVQEYVLLERNTQTYIMEEETI